MKRFSIIKKLAGITVAALVALGAAGCSNLDASETGNAQESSGGYGRVALTLPESTETTTYEFSNISLKYKASSATSYTSAGTWSSSSELAAATVSLPVGTYTFVLSATITIDDETDTYSGTASGTVEADKTTALSFTLKRTSSATADDDDENETVVGTLVTEGTYSGYYQVMDWNAADYLFGVTKAGEANDEGKYPPIKSQAAAAGTYGDVTLLSDKFKANVESSTETESGLICNFLQASKNGSMSQCLKFVVPINVSYITINARCGTDGQSDVAMKIATTDESSVQSFTFSGSDFTTQQFAYSLTATDDETQKVVCLYNADSNYALNIKGISVYAPTKWTKTSTRVSTKTSTSENATTYEEKGTVTVDLTVDTTATTSGSSITVKEAAGWFNSAYVIFNDSADSYTITCDNEKVDDELLRHYSTYKYYTNSYSDGQTTWTENSYSNVCRVDVLGLAAGSHTISITPAGKEATTVTATVLNHDRSGFAFTSDTTPGAYNKDGTLKSNAKVIYVTADNAKTVSLDITNSKGVTTTYTGLQKILENSTLKTSKDDISLDIRIIGKLSLSDLDYIASSAEGLQVKNNVNASKNPVPITIEGVGHDATIWGFGLMARDSSYYEISNLGIMCFLDDGISLDTGNMYAWVHNVDLFYGSTGGDSDQAKGDGSLDVKGNSQNNTYSYVHFWDSGKCSLCGMKSESGPNYLTYHHNWFDHSDSRHPRIRTMSVHIYNNYFDGNAKYGVGVTSGASAFVEQNVFRNPHDPMMSSKQGTDATGDGTFSGENGGIIKAYNNLMFQLGYNSVKFQYMTNKDEGWTSSDNDIDAYIVDNRSDTVPSTLTTVSGGTTYNNFDTVKGDTGLGLTNAPTEPSVALNNVVKYAGRHNPDFAWTFTNSEQDANYSLIKELKTALVNYTNTGLTKVGQ